MHREGTAHVRCRFAIGDVPTIKVINAVHAATGTDKQRHLLRLWHTAVALLFGCKRHRLRGILSVRAAQREADSRPALYFVFLYYHTAIYEDYTEEQAALLC